MGKHGDSVTYDGVQWHPRGDGYYQNKHRGLLHRYMYSQEVGEIPNGMHVHHRNHDKQDNRADNFVLLNPGEHWAEHGDERGEDWHAKGGRAAWERAQYRRYTCVRCSAEFESRGTTNARYCSAACRDAGSRARETRLCSVCGEPFECQTRYATRTCSRKCTSVHAYAQRGKGL
ncbi:HNH endonuclease [Streptomyces sp. IBSNAI001]|uniref:HNH endonuclease n=1 Tax=Streptomyces sp. IBSNAI001 TaxID=3457499 RepID=UPI003FCF3903